MKKTRPDDVVLVLSAEGTAQLDKMLGRKKERRISFHRLIDSADIHVLDPASGTALYRWKHLFWKTATPEMEAFFGLLEKLDVSLFFFVRLGHDLQDIEVRGGYTKNPFKVCVVREISMSV